MVHLQSTSAVDPARFPNSFRWDNLVRKHFDQYQSLIDAQTYRLQRIQRGFLVFMYSISHYRTPNTTTLNYLHLIYSKLSKKLEKSIKMKLTYIKTSTHALQLTIIEPSVDSLIYLILAQELEVAFSFTLLTSVSLSQLAQFCLLCQSLQAGSGEQLMQETSKDLWIS